jgi:hypothetical protein
MCSKLIKILFLLTPLTILADGLHDPADIPKFLQALKSGADHAAGKCFPHTKMPTIRRFGYRARSRKALKTLDQDFDLSYGEETEINYQIRKPKPPKYQPR